MPHCYLILLLFTPNLLTFLSSFVADIISNFRWQYFGSNAGLVRTFPGREWDTNFAGFYNDYDPRLRPWYIAATSGPKDVVIVLDCRYRYSVFKLIHLTSSG